MPREYPEAQVESKRVFAEGGVTREWDLPARRGTPGGRHPPLVPPSQRMFVRASS